MQKTNERNNVEQKLDRLHKKEKQLREELPGLIYSSNRIPAQLIKVDCNILNQDAPIRIEVKGQLRGAALALITSNNFVIYSITARRSNVIVFIEGVNP